VSTLVGLAASSIGIIAAEAQAYKVVKDYLLPVAIPLLLFNADLRHMIRSTGTLLLAFLVGSGNCLLCYLNVPHLKWCHSCITLKQIPCYYTLFWWMKSLSSLILDWWHVWEVPTVSEEHLWPTHVWYRHSLLIVVSVTFMWSPSYSSKPYCMRPLWNFQFQFTQVWNLKLW